MSIAAARRIRPASSRPFDRQSGVVSLIASKATVGLLWVALGAFLIIPTMSFLVLAFSPRLFGQGTAWLTASNLKTALGGVTLRGMVDSIAVSSFAAITATAVGVGIAWLVQRRDLPGRSALTFGLWAIMIVPTYVVGAGWEAVLGPAGLLRSAGIASPALAHLFFSGFGVAVVLALRGVPFAYFAISVAMAGLGRDVEDAARTHGGNRRDVARVAIGLLAPALFSSLVIVFAESIGDFGVAATIAQASSFPVATYQIYASISTFPAQFGVAAVVGWLLVAAVALALMLQARLTKGRSYAVIGGRIRPAAVRRLGLLPKLTATLAVGFFFTLALGVPVLGGFVASLFPPLEPLGLSHLTLAYYLQIPHSKSLGGSVLFSMRMATLAATATVAGAAIVARLVGSPRAGWAGRLVDLTMLTAVAIPGVVFAAGYVFTYNLGFWHHLGLSLYGTSTLLGIAYVGAALPTSARLLSGPMAQLQGSLIGAARVHGASPISAWRKAALPLVARSLMWAWLLAFSATFLELPVSEMLAPAGVTPVSVAVTQVLNKSNLSEGAALSVTAVLLTLGVIAAVLALWRVVAPAGWRYLGRTWWGPTQTERLGAPMAGERKGLAG